MRSRSAAAGETGSPKAADVSSSAASATQPAAGARGDAPPDIEDYELELIYSGESDGETDPKEPKAKDQSELAKPEPTKSDSRSALNLADRRDIFGSSNESDLPSPRRSRSAEKARKAMALAIGTILTVMQSCIRLILNLSTSAGRSFPNGPPSSSDAPCCTARQGPKHQPAVESEAPSYLPRVDTRATGRGNSSDVPSHRGSLTSAPRGNVGHRAHQSINEAEEETRSQMGLQLREDIEHKRSRRLGLVDNVTRLSSKRERDRSDFVFSQLENKQTQRSLRDELVEARQDISRLRGEISELQTRADSQHGEHEYLLEMLERKVFLHRKKFLTGDTA
uniref:RxLR effector candidate protein n=1 Tax=Hyaloperonospora arabidopsidis (strain Emoy2) TaxID=559515 RepID=M4B4E5_HYAAE